MEVLEEDMEIQKELVILLILDGLFLGARAILWVAQAHNIGQQ